MFTPTENFDIYRLKARTESAVKFGGSDILQSTRIPVLGLYGLTTLRLTGFKGQDII